MLEKTAQSKGGEARKAALSPEKRSEIAKAAAEARWGSSKATHEAELIIGDAKIPCAVLEDGTRILSQGGFLRALGRSDKPSGTDFDEATRIVTAKNLIPFISKDLMDSMKPISYVPKNGGRALGFKCGLLPQVCEVYLAARQKGDLHHTQERVAQAAEIIMRGLAQIGITALIDEATGYQEIRNKEALRALLDAFLMKEFAAWAKRFPDEFYKEIFRLRGWAWNKLSVKRPILVGKLTNDIVYERLLPGVLNELQNRNPKDVKGRRKATHHQFLTDDIGNPALAQHLHAVIALMRASSSWAQFHEMLDRSFPKRGDVLQLELINDE